MDQPDHGETKVTCREGEPLSDGSSDSRTLLGGSVALGRDRRLWALAALLIVALVGGSYGLLRNLDHSVVPPFVSGEAGERVGPILRVDGVLRMAGAGSALPLARALVTGFVVKHPEAKIRVHESVGSTAGLRALQDGAVDLGLVSRSLRADELASGVRVVPYALDAVVFAANPSVPVDGVSYEEIVAIYAGKRLRWSDGSRVVVFQRPSNDASHIVAGKVVAGFAAADAQARRNVLWNVLFNTDSLQRMLVQAPGAVGLMDLGAAVSEGLPLKILTLEGVTPDETTVRDGSYPLRLELSFVSRTRSARGVETEFLRFVFSERGEQIIRDNGYIPLPLGSQ